MRNEPTIEDVKAFWDARPCNVRHSPLEVGTKDYFDQVEQRKYFVEPHIPAFADFPRWQGKRVLEIGCGIGTDAVNFARNGADYVGVDLSQESLEIVERRFKIFEVKGQFFCGDAESVADLVGDGQPFDLIYSFGVIHHTPNPGAVLSSARRLCHANSQLRLMVYAKNSWKAAMIDAGLDQPEAQFGCPIAETFTEEGLTDLLNSGGFRAEEVWQDHIFPYDVDSYRRYEYTRQAWFEAMDAEVFRALEKSFGWHMLSVASPCYSDLDTMSARVVGDPA